MQLPLRWKFALLYFSEGAPIGFLWWALPTLLRQEAVAIERITMLVAALALPWAGKFLWAPLVDAWRGPSWGFRHWAASAQMGMGVVLLPLIWLDPVGQFGLWFGLLLVHGFCAATQDVAIDALAVRSVESGERGQLNAAMQIGMLGGRSVFGGGAILLMGWGGWPVVFGALIAAIWGSLLVLWWGIEEPPEEVRDTASERSFFRTLGQVFRQSTTWWALGFALVAGAGFEAAGALAGPLLVDRGAGSETVGWFFALPVVGAMALGGWWAGRWSDQGSRIGRTAGALIAVTVMVGLTATVIALEVATPWLLVTLTVLYLSIGAFTAVSYALFMDLTDRRLGATQFSTYMAATNGCEAWAVAVAGGLIGGWGYGGTLGGMAGLGLFGLVFLQVIRRTQSKV